MYMIGGLLKAGVFSLMLVLPDLSGRVEGSTPLLPGDSMVPEMTLENVYREILFRDIKHPEIVLKQVVYETMWLKCTRCSMDFNNLFGFTTRRGYMKFKNWVDCIKFYKQWQERLHVTGNEDYYAVLKRARFAVYQEYNKRLRSIPVRHITEKFGIPVKPTLPNPVDVLVRIDK